MNGVQHMKLEQGKADVKARKEEADVLVAKLKEIVKKRLEVECVKEPNNKNSEETEYPAAKLIKLEIEPALTPTPVPEEISQPWHGPRRIFINNTDDPFALEISQDNGHDSFKSETDSTAFKRKCKKHLIDHARIHHAAYMEMVINPRDTGFRYDLRKARAVNSKSDRTPEEQIQRKANNMMSAICRYKQTNLVFGGELRTGIYLRTLLQRIREEKLLLREVVYGKWKSENLDGLVARLERRVDKEPFQHKCIVGVIKAAQEAENRKKRGK